jgi:hypothetical protein
MATMALIICGGGGGGDSEISPLLQQLAPTGNLVASPPLIFVVIAAADKFVEAGLVFSRVGTTTAAVVVVVVVVVAVLDWDCMAFCCSRATTNGGGVGSLNRVCSCSHTSQQHYRYAVLEVVRGSRTKPQTVATPMSGKSTIASKLTRATQQHTALCTTGFHSSRVQWLWSLLFAAW